MKGLSAEAPAMVKSAVRIIKVRQNLHRPADVCVGPTDGFLSTQSVNALQKQAEGLCEILSVKPSAASLEVHRAVFGAPLPPADRPATSGRPIQRAAEEAAEADCYRRGRT